MKAFKKLLSFILVFSLIVAAIPISVSAARPFESGSGTEDDPYVITTTTHLNNIRQYPSRHFILGNNIVFAEEEYEEGGAFYNKGNGWKPISAFSGSLNGNGYSIENLYIYNKTDSAYTGFIETNTGDIYNLTIGNSFIMGEGYHRTYTGVFAAKNSGNILQCTSSENIVSSYNGGTSYTGGIVGSNTGTLTLCYNTSVVAADGDNSVNSLTVGGISGINESEGMITYCYNYGSVFGKSAGGITGSCDSAYILLCYNGGAINDDTSASYIGSGGIVAFSTNASVISGCVNTGKVFAYSSAYCAYAAGIVGYNVNSYISDSYNSGSISATTTDSSSEYAAAGGIVGKNEYILSSEPYIDTVSTVYNRGSLTASTQSSSTKKYIGGIAGSSDSAITSSYYLNNTTKGIGNNTAGTDGTKKLTGTQMKSASSYKGFDFADMWWISSKSGYDYPQLTLLSEYPAESIEITQMPNKTYYAGEELDLSGGKMKVTYSNGKSETLGTEELSVLEYNPYLIGEQTALVVYAQFVVYLELNLKAPKEVPDEIMVASPPSKLTYVQGQPLEASDIVIFAFYGEEDIFEINANDLEFSYDTSAVGDVEVTVSYKNKTASFNIEVLERVAKTVAINSKPASVVYQKGSELSLDGGALTVVFDSKDNYTEDIEISADMVSGFNMNTLGQQKVTVKYQEQTATFDIFVIDGIPGDINGDGNKTTADLANLKLYLAGHKDSSLLLSQGYADFNFDSVITTADLAALKINLANS